MDKDTFPFPSFEKILVENPGWLEGFVNTEEASRLTGVPVDTLVTMRSRKTSGPPFVRPKHTRLVRYQRRALFDWMFSGGVHRSTSSIDEGQFETDCHTEDERDE